MFSKPCSTLEFRFEEGIAVEPYSFNLRWLAAVACCDAAKSYVGREVSCSGATFGPRKPMIDYLQRMDSLLTNKYYPLGPTDQGAHNYIRYEQKVNGIEDVPYRTRRVQNMQGQTTCGRKGKYTVDAAGNITSVIHQWDRHSDLYHWPNEMLS